MQWLWLPDRRDGWLLELQKVLGEGKQTNDSPNALPGRVRALSNSTTSPTISLNALGCTLAKPPRSLLPSLFTVYHALLSSTMDKRQTLSGPLASHIRNKSMGAPAQGASPVLLARIEEKKRELANLKDLKALSAGLADQMEQLEQKLATLSDGTEAVAAVLSNWHNVLRAISMASGKMSQDYEYVLKLKCASQNSPAKRRGRGTRRKGRCPSPANARPHPHPTGRLSSATSKLEQHWRMSFGYDEIAKDSMNARLGGCGGSPSFRPKTLNSPYLDDPTQH